MLSGVTPTDSLPFQRREPMSTCVICGASTSNKYACSRPCVNTRRNNERKQELAALLSVKPKRPTVAKIKAIRSAFKASGIRAGSHELNAVRCLPKDLVPYWIGLGKGKSSKMRVVFSGNIAEHSCPACRKIAAGCTLTGNVYCSHKCYAVNTKRNTAPKREARKAFLKKPHTPYVFTVEDVAKYRKLRRKFRGPARILDYLLEHDIPFAEKFAGQNAKSLAGFDYLARGGKPPKCPTCGKTRRVTFNDQGGLRRYCGPACSNPSAAVQLKKDKTLYENHGVLNPHLVDRFRFKEVKVGRTVHRVQGYEPQAIRYLLSKGVRPSRIRSGNSLPVIRYRHAGRSRKYFPDLQVGKRILVEVKSGWTVFNTQELFEQVVAKARACFDAGWDFRLLLMKKNGSRIKLPRNWYERPYEEFIHLRRVS